MKKRYVLCGASGRGLGMYAKALTGPYADVGELVGVFDINPMRAAYVRDCADPSGQIPVFTDFDEMIGATKPDCAIVVTMDSYHHEYTVRALDHGLDVICEKPMTIDAEKTKAIFEAENRNDRRIVVTFNARFSPFHIKIKQLLAQNVVGDVLSVNLDWLLDRHHGADYFRRWHRELKNGGGLLVTKATHHFDMVNWWIEQDPVTVYANGNLSFYGPTRERRAERCQGCPHFKTCDLAMDWYDDLYGSNAKEHLTKMYFEPEVCDGYVRDQCVFGPSDIWDNMSLSVRYGGGALLTYSLNAYLPYEGWHLSINGTKGRLEAHSYHRGPDKNLPLEITVYYPDQEKVVYHEPKATGVHGGSDTRILDALFRGVDEDPYHQNAGSREGAMSILIGSAANLSIQSGQPVNIQDLVDFGRYGR